MSHVRSIVLVLAVVASAPQALATAGGAPDGHDVREFAVLLDLDGADDVRTREIVWFEEGDTRLRADVYRPDDVGRGRPLPTVVLLNAAGDAPDSPARTWNAYRSWSRLFAASGLGAVTFDLRPDHRDDDLARAFAFLRERGADHGIDPERVGVWAVSAHVGPASGAVIDGPAGDVRCAAFFYGVPVDDPLPSDLPVLLVVAGRDAPVVRDGMRAAVVRELQRGGRIEAIQLPEARHAFDLIDDADWTRATIRRTLEFFREHLGAVDESRDRSPGLTPLQRGTAHYVSDEWDAAATAYLSYVWENPDDPVAQFRMGRAAALADRCPQALPALARAADLDHRKGDALLLAARCMAATDRPDLAYENLRRAAIVEPANLARVYADPVFAAVRGRPEVRDLLRESANWSEVRVAPRGEPGRPLDLILRLVGPDGHPVPGARVYAYQTGADGRYPGADPAHGDPRLFAHAVSGDDGRVVLHTVVPGAYPGGGVPAHVHYEIEPPEGPRVEGEVLFADDPALDDDARAAARRRGWPVVRPEPRNDGRFSTTATVHLD